MIDLAKTPAQRILITGITGTLGRAVCEKLLRDCGDNIEIIGISRDEQKLRTMPRDPRLHVFAADICDPDSLEDALSCAAGMGIDQIYHFAAMKCVEFLERQPWVAERVNIRGTRNVVNLARQHFSRVVMASTDKAVYPINAYGASKMMAEHIVLGEPTRENAVVRYGNVIGSRGSFLDTLEYTLIKERRAQITHQDMTRFWWTIADARDFVIRCGYGQQYGIHYPHWIKSSTVTDFIKAVADVLGVTVYEMLPPVGIRSGEKLHECLASAEETGTKPIFSSDKDRLMGKRELRDVVEKALKLRGSV